MINFTIFIDRLTEQIKNLPGEKAHAELMPLNRPFTSEAMQHKPNFRQSAVAIFIYPEGNEIHSILIQRPNYNGTHSGQISFPGGKMDETDPNLEFTARRESFEEVNIPIEQGKLIGKLSDIYIPISNFLVEPYLFYLTEAPVLKPDEREVEAIILFPINELLKENLLKTEDMKMGNGLVRKNIPYYDIQGLKVWGATGMILSEFKSILLRIQSF